MNEELTAFIESHTTDGTTSADAFVESFLRFTGRLLEHGYRTECRALLAERGLLLTDRPAVPSAVVPVGRPSEGVAVHCGQSAGAFGGTVLLSLKGLRKHPITGAYV